jgi:hypothetical protein
MPTELNSLITDYDQNVENIQHWVMLKGEYRYKKIIDFMNQNKIPCDWKTISNYIRYDKRILINAFKYLAFLDELYKSFIIAYKEDDTSDKKILGLSFNELLCKYYSLGTKAVYEEIDVELLDREQKTINEFRNQVVHNKIILGKNYGGKSIDETLSIFVNILPKTYRKGFISDIKGCTKELVENTWHIDYNESEKKFVIVS